VTHEMIDGTFRQTNLKNESDDYLAKREQLRLAEIELMKQGERVAEIRRARCRKALRSPITNSSKARERSMPATRRSER
jgi:predicted dithiol-disulfide oxidoreductase (DUF899 family)